MLNVRSYDTQDPIDEEDDWDLADQVQDTLNNPELASKIQDGVPDEQEFPQRPTAGKPSGQWCT